MLIVELRDHGSPLVAARPYLVDYLCIVVQCVDLCEISLIQAQFLLYLLDFEGLVLEGCNSG